MDIKPIVSQSVWKEFFDNAGSPSFLQSWEWGEFQKSEGCEIERIGVYQDSTLQAIALIIKIKSKRGSFLFIPHGPIIIQNSESKIQSLLETLLDYLASIAKDEGYSFIRIAPVLYDNDKNRAIFSNLGFRKAPIYMHAERMWVLPLTSEVKGKHVNSKTSEVLHKTDDELLASMRKTTRYLIRKAQRDGVTIEKRIDEKAVDDFWKIYQETARREKFVPFSKKFIVDEFEAFNKSGNAIFLFGGVTGDLFERDPGSAQRASERALTGMRTDQAPSLNSYLAAALIIFTKSTAFYHQGASIHSKIPVPYLLQWEAIKEAKKRGCTLYNFWGILQKGRTPKNWEGLTLFKTGFGGRQVDFVSTQDFIISKKYHLTRLYEKFLSWRRGV